MRSVPIANPHRDDQGSDPLLVTRRLLFSQNLFPNCLLPKLPVGHGVARRAQRVQDIANYVPNLSIIANSGGGTIVTIRGVGSDSRNIGFDSRVGVYIDGVYLGQSPALDQDLLGLARVEVLRGPQGSLFGKNTVAGAINLVTERPSRSFTGEAFTRIGTMACASSPAASRDLFPTGYRPALRRRTPRVTATSITSTMA